MGKQRKIKTKPENLVEDPSRFLEMKAYMEYIETNGSIVKSNGTRVWYERGFEHTAPTTYTHYVLENGEKISPTQEGISDGQFGTNIVLNLLGIDRIEIFNSALQKVKRDGFNWLEEKISQGAVLPSFSGYLLWRICKSPEEFNLNAKQIRGLIDAIDENKVSRPTEERYFNNPNEIFGLPESAYKIKMDLALHIKDISLIEKMVNSKLQIKKAMESSGRIFHQGKHTEYDSQRNERPGLEEGLYPIIGDVRHALSVGSAESESGWLTDIKIIDREKDPKGAFVYNYMKLMGPEYNKYSELYIAFNHQLLKLRSVFKGEGIKINEFESTGKNAATISYSTSGYMGYDNHPLLVRNLEFVNLSPDERERRKKGILVKVSKNDLGDKALLFSEEHV